MNTENQSPLIPQGSLLLEQKNKGRTRFKLVVSIVLAVHGIALIALLMAGCQKEKEPVQSSMASAQDQAPTNTPPPLETPTNATPAADTNTSATAAMPVTPPAPPVTPPAPPVGTTQDYKVVAGDSFSSIAHKNHITTKALMEANPGVEPTKLQIGQTIKIPPPTVAPTTPTATAGTGTVDATSGDSANTYTVKSGDTLTTIAKKEGVSLRALRAANNLTTDRIKVGDKLKIPAKTASTTTTASTNPPAQ